jgi:hypothetical protein
MGRRREEGRWRLRERVREKSHAGLLPMVMGPAEIGYRKKEQLDGRNEIGVQWKWDIENGG